MFRNASHRTRKRASSCSATSKAGVTRIAVIRHSANAASQVAYAAALLSGLAGIPGIDVSVLDIRHFNQSVVNAPGFLSGLGSTSFGKCAGEIHAPDTPCELAAIEKTLAGQPYLGSSDFTYDGIHRDANVNEALARCALAQLPLTEPEPGMISLLAIGLFGAGMAGPRRRARR